MLKQQINVVNGEKKLQQKQTADDDEDEISFTVRQKISDFVLRSNGFSFNLFVVNGYWLHRLLAVFYLISVMYTMRVYINACVF